MLEVFRGCLEGEEMKKKALLKKRVKALQNASTVLEWTIAVRMAKWGRLMNDNS